MSTFCKETVASPNIRRSSVPSKYSVSTATIGRNDN